MAFPDSATLIRWVFSLSRVGTDEDIAEFGIWVDPTAGVLTDTELAELCIGGFNAWNDHVGEGAFCNNVFLSFVYASQYHPDGKTRAEQSFAPTVAWQGTSPPPALPWETSLALSLYTYPRGTFIANGKRKRGRIYLPPMSAQVLDGSNSGYFSNSGLPAFFESLANFIRHVGEDHEGTPKAFPSVFSRMDGVLRPITEISIDAKFDSQRRRQNREKAGYLGITL